MDEILWCDHSNKTSSAERSHSTVYILVLYKMKFGIRLNFWFRHSSDRSERVNIQKCYWYQTKSVKVQSKINVCCLLRYKVPLILESCLQKLCCPHQLPSPFLTVLSVILAVVAEALSLPLSAFQSKTSSIKRQTIHSNE